ncbi:VWA domain-containing protein [Methanoculleus sp.]|uniref:VWA domain-containing protein n=1 Tax=Methanoculleus sp. TaxID=90427 RepID=UPI001BD22B2D|nr:VWA domain-containing protein [Methanoculleus sp.]
MTVQYPFPAIMGQENAKKAILCALANEDINGILIVGERGTAKTTLIRSMEALSGEKEIRTIPQNVTEDRLLGAIDIETAVTEGAVCLSPGILAEGNRQILFVDDINLLREEAVHSVLSASETRRIVIEREGFSDNVETKFILAATMDPAEGELPFCVPDRFDLCVRLDRIEDEEMRIELLRNRLLFERAPEEFSAAYEHDVVSLRETIENAQERLPYVSIPDGHLELISNLCLELGVSGQRGDLAVARTAKALAALDKRDSVVFDDIKLAALLALEHRRGEAPPPIPDTPPCPETDECGDPPHDDSHKNTGSDGPGTRTVPRSPQQCDAMESSEGTGPAAAPHDTESVFGIGSTFEVIGYLNEKSKIATRRQKSGRRTRVICSDRSGRYISFRLPGKNKNDIAFAASLRTAAPYQRFRKKRGLAISLKASDLREKVREKKTARTILFLVDGSGSMGARRRMVVVKGAILSLLTDAYQKRDRVGLMVFQGQDARLLLPPTKSTDVAVRLLRNLPTGGRTPLVKGIVEAATLLTRGGCATPEENKTVVLLTDGRGNVSSGSKDPYEELSDTAKKVAGTGIRFVVVDTEEGYPRIGMALKLAGDLEATYFRLEELDSGRLADSVRGLVYGEE